MEHAAARTPKGGDTDKGAASTAGSDLAPGSAGSQIRTPCTSLQPILVDRDRLPLKLFDDIIKGIIRDRGKLLEVLAHLSGVRRFVDFFKGSRYDSLNRPLESHVYIAVVLLP